MYQKHPTRRLMTLLIAAAAIGGTVPAQAGWFDSPLFGGSDSTRLAKWLQHPDGGYMRWGDWDRLKVDGRAGGEDGPPNQQPVQIAPEQIAAALLAIQCQPYKEVRQLFSDDEVKRFAPAIAGALQRATPNDDLIFVSTGQHAWSGLVAPVLGNVGRIFVQDGRLNVILGMMHADFVSDYNQGSRQFPNFDYGSRSFQTKGIKLVGVSSGEAKLIRDDWIAVTLPPIQTLAQQREPQPVATPLVVPASGGAPVPAATVAPAAAAGTATAAAVVAAPAMVPAGDPNTDSFYRKQESRLRALQRLRDQGLITDAEFQQKRAEILKDL